MSWPVAPAPSGLDVVDRADPRTRGKSEDARFIDRIFTEVEAEAIRSAPDPDLRLWMFWAAKEAVFKRVTRLRGSAPVFEHAAFQVTLAAAPEAGESGREASDEPGWHPVGRGVVRHEEVDHPVLWSTRGGIVCLAHPPGIDPVEVQVGVTRIEAAADRWGLTDDERTDPAVAAERLLGEEERSAVHSIASVLVRRAAHEALAGLLAPKEAAERLRIVTPSGPSGRTPPHAEVGGRVRSDLDVSITHHGRLIAWCVRSA